MGEEEEPEKKTKRQYPAGGHLESVVSRKPDEESFQEEGPVNCVKFFGFGFVFFKLEYS